ncbi:hypothetical protein COE45_05645 [Bacillus thuringiensis]|nr:hypothetical protein COE45_05645 [Bacillus thuringiensis]
MGKLTKFQNYKIRKVKVNKEIATAIIVAVYKPNPQKSKNVLIRKNGLYLIGCFFNLRLFNLS